MKKSFYISLFASYVSLLTLSLSAHAGDGDGEKSVAVKASLSAEIEIEVHDDILVALDLPIVADELRSEGVEEEDVKDALEGANESGLSAAETSEVLYAEVEAKQTRDKPLRGFGVYVQKLLADGLRGKELAAKIHERKEELDQPSDEEREKLKKRLQAQRTKHVEKRKELHAKLIDLRKAGKKVAVEHEKWHVKLKNDMSNEELRKRLHAKVHGTHPHPAKPSVVNDKKVPEPAEHPAHPLGKKSGHPHSEFKDELEKQLEKVDNELEQREAKQEKLNEKKEKIQEKQELKKEKKQK